MCGHQIATCFLFIIFVVVTVIYININASIWQPYERYVKPINLSFLTLFLSSTGSFTLSSDYGVNPPPLVRTHTQNHTHTHITPRDLALRQESQGWVGHYGGPWLRLNTNLRSLTLASYIPQWMIHGNKTCVWVCVCVRPVKSNNTSMLFLRLTTIQLQ